MMVTKLLVGDEVKVNHLKMDKKEPGSSTPGEVTPTVPKHEAKDVSSGKSIPGKKILKKKLKTNLQPVKVEGKTEPEVTKTVDTPKAKDKGKASSIEKTPKPFENKANDTPGGSKQSSKRKRKRGGSAKNEQTPNKKPDSNNKTPATQIKTIQPAKQQPNPVKDDKIGGLIFMCNTRTKPDCFRYGVFGLPQARLDTVLQIRPGYKLFLYDIDTKLMHGVFEASTPGALRHEPAAFQGGYPAQVKFNIFKDCHPLPESEFKKALEDSYGGGKKFKAELTFSQAKKLAKLFRSIDVPPPRKHNPVPYERDGFINKGAPPPVLYEEDYRREVAYIPDKEYPPYPIREPFLIPARNVIPLEPSYAEGPLIRREHVPRDHVPRDHVPRDHVPRELVPRELVPRELVPRELVPRELVPLEHVPRELVPREPVLIKEEPAIYAPVGGVEYAPPPSAIPHQPPPGYHAAYRREEALPPPVSVGAPARNGAYYPQEYAVPADPYGQHQRMDGAGAYSLSTRGGGEYRDSDVVERYTRYDHNAARLEYPALRSLAPPEQVRAEPSFIPVSSRYSFAGPSYR